MAEPFVAGSTDGSAGYFFQPEEGTLVFSSCQRRISQGTAEPRSPSETPQSATDTLTCRSS
jgi:hypothetical protein